MNKLKQEFSQLNILIPYQSEISEIMNSVSTSLIDFAQMMSSYSIK